MRRSQKVWDLQRATCKGSLVPTGQVGFRGLRDTDPPPCLLLLWPHCTAGRGPLVVCAAPFSPAAPSHPLGGSAGSQWS